MDRLCSSICPGANTWYGRLLLPDYHLFYLHHCGCDEYRNDGAGDAHEGDDLGATSSLCLGSIALSNPWFDRIPLVYDISDHGLDGSRLPDVLLRCFLWWQ